ncbi:MAG TPA: glycoside hydrolase family 76 protein, partial [Solirubrobacterales bacterium]|nr:glycoside hydrolase family 76 protein [Solirubrobacterales bacterium]
MSLVRRSSIVAVITLLALVLVGLAVLPSASSALSRSQRHYLAAANKGVKQTHKWWNHGRHWYASVLGGPNAASLWGIVPLFEALNGLQIAQPSHRHRRELNRFARGAERYLNPNLEPVPGFGPKPGQREPGKTTWFDDNGWWGLSFLDAYRATGNGRWLTDAQIAQNFISVSGWDTTAGRPGGIWWNTNHSFYAGESLAGGTLLSARLYAITHDQHYLDDALKYIAWADVWLTDPTTGLYARLRKPKTYKKPAPDGSTTATAAAADQKALNANPDEAAKLEAAGTHVPGPGEAQSSFNNYPAFAPSPMPYVNGPMILA